MNQKEVKVSFFKNIFSGIPSGIWFLGFVALLTNVSSIISLTFAPIFLTTVLGANMTTVGILEGVIEAVSLFTRVFSGMLSDWIGKRKILILSGAVIAAISRACLAAATSVHLVFYSRVLDRISNGIQASPRDALVGDLAPQHMKGACYGLRQTFAVFGSLLGAALGIILMWATSHHYRFIFSFAVLPAFCAIFLLMIGVKEPERKKEERKTKTSFHYAALFDLPAVYWKLVFLSFLFMMGNLSGAFVILSAKHQGVPEAFLPSVMVIQNLVTTLVAFPFGKLSDSFDRRWVLAFGFLMLTLSHVVLGIAPNIFVTMVGICLCGLQMGVTQSVFLVFVTETCPEHLRGTGFGVFHCMNGTSLLLANTAMGLLWDQFSPGVAFLATAGSSLLGLVALPWLAPSGKKNAN